MPIETIAVLTMVLAADLTLGWLVLRGCRACLALPSASRSANERPASERAAA